MTVLLSCGCETDLDPDDGGRPWQIGEATLCDCKNDGLVYIIEFLPSHAASPVLDTEGPPAVP